MFSDSSTETGGAPSETKAATAAAAAASDAGNSWPEIEASQISRVPSRKKPARDPRTWNRDRMR